MKARVIVAEGSHLAWISESTEHSHLLALTDKRMELVDLLNIDGSKLESSVHFDGVVDKELSAIDPAHSFEQTAAMHAALDDVERKNLYGSFMVEKASSTTSVINQRFLASENQLDFKARLLHSLEAFAVLNRRYVELEEAIKSGNDNYSAADPDSSMFTKEPLKPAVFLAPPMTARSKDVEKVREERSLLHNHVQEQFISSLDQQLKTLNCLSDVVEECVDAHQQ